ncbi:MAG: transcription-repair coupling factor, partial [Desulfofustis sp.]|nr:transcription-repair coupling factor [Desulfofustis sp.]
LMEYNELGGGFKLAMSDLQIRGGGNLLGVSQSGHIAAIGYDLYLDLLQKTVADLKAQKSGQTPSGSSEDLDPEINLKVSAYIPESYIADIEQRYIMYRRIAQQSRTTFDDDTDLREELADRFGALPEEVTNLFEVVAIKKAMVPLRIEKLERGPGNLVFSFMADTPVKAEQLLALVAERTNKLRLTPDSRLIIRTEQKQDRQLFETIGLIIAELQTLTEEHVH